MKHEARRSVRNSCLAERKGWLLVSTHSWSSFSVSACPPGDFGTSSTLVSCNRSSQHNSAPKERHNIAHGEKPWVEAPSPSPFPSPARAGEGCRRPGERLGTQATASRLPNGTPEAREFINELQLQYTNGASPQPDNACLRALLQCKNLTHLHQIFDFKISSLGQPRQICIGRITSKSLSATTG
jgi:hypothetical protein